MYLNSPSGDNPSNTAASDRALSASSCNMELQKKLSCVHFFTMSCEKSRAMYTKETDFSLEMQKILSYVHFISHFMPQ